MSILKFLLLLLAAFAVASAAEARPLYSTAYNKMKNSLGMTLRNCC